VDGEWTENIARIRQLTKAYNKSCTWKIWKESTV